ncbi:MAG TPA: MFS transporter [Mycobacteriales bacterium]|jgi:putative MFS transporter|nr:MFS transporter [Mycobacteriales bacterium]
MTTSTSSAQTDARSVLARLDRIPVWSLPRYYLVIIGVGYFFTFFDIADIGYGMPAIAKQFKLSGSTTTFVALSIGLIGYAVGSLVIGLISDRFGRYKILLFTIGLTAAGSFLDATATGVKTLSLWRFITGMGVGADLNLVSTYVGELSPARLRGRISNLTFLVGIIGQAVTPFVALALVPNYSSGWRWLFVIGGVIATVGLVGRFELPESPRWLALHGKPDEADQIVARMENTARERGVELTDPDVTDVSSEFDKMPLRALFKAPYGRRLAVLIPMWFLWYIGNYGFLGDSATLLGMHGYDINNSILFLGVGGLGYPIGATAMAAVADKIERKLLLLASSLVWLVGMVLIGTLANEAVLVIGAFLGALGLGMWLQVAYTYTAENFPTRSRSTGFAVSDGVGHAGGAVGGLALPHVVAGATFFTGFAGIGVTGALAGIVAMFGPSSSGRRLEDMSG